MVEIYIAGKKIPIPEIKEVETIFHGPSGKYNFYPEGHEQFVYFKGMIPMFPGQEIRLADKDGLPTAETQYWEVESTRLLIDLEDKVIFNEIYIKDVSRE